MKNKKQPYISSGSGGSEPITRSDAAKRIRAHRLAHKKYPSWYEVYIDTYDNIKQIILYEPYENSHSIIIKNVSNTCITPIYNAQT